MIKSNLALLLMILRMVDFGCNGNGIYIPHFLYVYIQLMILAQRVMVLKRFMDKENNSSWKIILQYFLFQIGGELILKCNFDTRKLPVYLPAFYKECLDDWSALNESSVLLYEDIVNQVIWNNKNITVQKLLLFEKKVCFLKELSQLVTSFLIRESFLRVLTC